MSDAEKRIATAAVRPRNDGRGDGGGQALMYGIFYLALLGLILAAGCGVSALLLWGLYSMQGGRLGLLAWLRQL